MKILICDTLNKQVVEELYKIGDCVDISTSLTKHEDLKKHIQDSEIIVIRSSTKLTKEIDKHSTALKQIALTQTNDQKNIINIKNQSQKLSDSVVELSQLSQNNLEVQNKIDELSKSFLLLEETVQAFDSYRRQNNEMLQEMQLEISSINMSNTP